MKITSQQTEKLLTGNQAFSQLGFSMLLTRLKTRYVNNPAPDTVQACTTEINTFLAKFNKIMADDYAVITKL